MTATRKGHAAVFGMFPGQGSQKVGMLSEFMREYPRITSKVLQALDEVVDYPLSSILTVTNKSTDPKDSLLLTQTEYAQPALVAHAAVVTSIIKERSPNLLFNATLGHSVGEFSAIGAASNSSTDTISTWVNLIKAVHVRGLAMKNAVKHISEDCSMVALYPIKDIEDVHHAIKQNTSLVCEIANYNSDSQIVLSGHTHAIKSVIESVQQKFRKIPLNVSAPFHCSLMQPAAAEFQSYLQSNNMITDSLTTPIISNVTALPITDINLLSSLLIRQITAPVKWSQSISYCKGHYPVEFLDFGYTPVLSKLLPKNTIHYHVGTISGLATYYANP